MTGLLLATVLWAVMQFESRNGNASDRTIRILIVDDHLAVAHGVGTLLKYGADDIDVIGIASTVDECFDQVARQKPDVVLMDIHLPDRSGIEAARKIIQGFPSVKVAIFTGSHASGDVHDAMAAGVSGFLLKESSPDALASAIRTIHSGGSVVDPSVMPMLLDAPQPTAPELNDDEQNLLRFASEGLENPELAKRLAISESTLRRQFQALFKKLGVDNRIQAITYAARNGLL